MLRFFSAPLNVNLPVFSFKIFLSIEYLICGFTHFHCSFFSVAGISGSSKTGCNSLVLAGGYEEDKDHGYEFTYSGKTMLETFKFLKKLSKILKELIHIQS